MSTLPVVTFGALLRRARLAAGLSQEELAERAQLSRETISTLERQTRRAPRKDTIDLLADALGLAPAERARLHQAARGQMAAAPSVPHLPEARELLPLAGRGPEVARLEQHLEGSGPPLLLFAGEPGMGKSRLLAEAVERAKAQGWTVLSGGCHRRSGQEPFAPLLGALESTLRRTAPAALRAHLDSCAWLVRLLPELAETTLVPAPSWSLPPEQERRLMFAAVARYLANVAGPAGTLLVLDDLQWAGVDALDLLAALLRTPGEQQLRVVGAYRNTEVHPPDLLLSLLADLGMGGLAGEIRLGPLAPEEASTLLLAVLEAEQGTDNALRERLVARTGGVPFFLVSCARALQGGVPGDDLPWDVTQHLRQRIAALPQAAQELLGVAAIVGREAPAAFLLRLALQPDQGSLAVLEVLNHARLLMEVGEDTVQFAHDLIREVVLSDLSATRRRALHRRVAETLEQMPGEPPIERLAYHYARAGMDEQSVLYLERAGDRARAVLANAEALDSYQSAVARLEAMGRATEAARMREKLGYLLFRLARYEQALSVLEQALETYRHVGDIDGQGRTTALICAVWDRLGKRAESIERLERAVVALQEYGPSLGLAALYTQLAELYDGRPHERLEACQRAEASAPAASHTFLGHRWRASRAGALLELARLREARTVLEELLPEVRATDDMVALRLALFMEAGVYLHQGSFPQERQCIEQILEIAQRLEDQFQQATYVSRRGRNAFHRGDWQEAQRDLEDALLRFPRPLSEGIVTALPYSLGLLRQAVGRQEEARQLFETAIEKGRVGTTVLVARWAQTALAEEEVLEGRPEQARTRLEALRSQTTEPELGIIYALPMLAWAQLEVGAVEQAKATLQQALALTRAEHMRPVLAGALCIQARLSIGQQRWDEAQDALEESLALCQAMPFPYAEAKALYVYGRLHRAKGEPELARERLEAALAILNWLGERFYAEYIERALAEGRRP